MNKRPRNLFVLSTGTIIRVERWLTPAALIGGGALLAVIILRLIYQA